MTDQHAAMTLAEARRRAAAAAVALRGPIVPTAPRRAVGRVLAEPVLARTPIPHAATSAMDGWAVAGDGPWRLRPAAEAAPSPAQPPSSPAPGEAVAVVTGSPIPAGVDSVLRAEHGTVRPQGGGELLHADPTTGDLAAGRHIRPAGAEAAAGETLLAAGSVVTPAAAAVAAVAGHDLLPVRPAPQVTLICTGEEVITAGLPAPGQVRDAFEVSVPAAVEAMGGRTAAVRRIGDAVDALVEALAAAGDDDCAGEATDARGAAPRLILTTGGTAGSAADALHPALDQLGAELIVDGIAMRPGHPTVLARLGDSLVLGMPGNPLAGFAALLGLGRVVLDGLAGHEKPADRRLDSRRAAEELPGARRGTRLLPVIDDDAGVVPAGRDGSAMLRGLAAADALAEVPAGGVAVGSTARLHLLPWTTDRGEAAWDA